MGGWQSERKTGRPWPGFLEPRSPLFPALCLVKKAPWGKMVFLVKGNPSSIIC